MSNGGLTPEETLHLIENGTVEQKLEAIGKIVINIDKTCYNRQCQCDERYVSKDWLKMKIGFVMAFGAGTGVAGKEIITKILKTIGILSS